MSTNPIDKNATPNPTGNLEELFRHHLGEEAAVPPRPLLWDQIDNALLLRQNALYRRRLTATRWVAAASLLLATLAGTGWWARRDLTAGQGEVAATRPAGPGATGGERPGERRPAGAASRPAADASALAARNLAGEVATVPATANAAAGPSTTMAPARPGNRRRAVAAPAFGLALAARPAQPGGAGGPTGRFGAAGRQAAGGPAVAALTQSKPAAAPTAAGAAATGGATDLGGAVLAAAPAGTVGEVATATPAAGAITEAATAAAAPVASGSGELVGTLAARDAALALAGPAALPAGLAPLPLPEAAPAPRHWRYGASYAAGLFNPNINFSRAGIAPEYDYSPNPIFGENSPAITERAAAEYRDHLRPGLSQRLALLATRRLRGHWSLATGVELGQATAHSASAAAFVGEQLFDLNPLASQPLRTTSFRYRTAGIPVEVRYANAAKRGWSLYGRLGGVVTALLGVRSEAEGYPEATRTYSITSAGTPYRRVLGTARGAVGVQFRPAAAGWALTVGPTAEVNLLSLNAHPAQGLLHQSRAYGFGMEVGMEFGK